MLSIESISLVLLKHLDGNSLRNIMNDDPILKEKIYLLFDDSTTKLKEMLSVPYVLQELSVYHSLLANIPNNLHPREDELTFSKFIISYDRKYLFSSLTTSPYSR